MKNLFAGLVLALFALSAHGSGVSRASNYAPSAVAITGGTINGATVGATTPAAGTFSTLTSSNVAITGGAISGTTGQIATAQTDATNALAGGHYGQTWQNVSGSRVAGTTYTNSTGKIIAITIRGTMGVNQSGICYLTVAGLTVAAFQHYDPNIETFSFFSLIPDGAQYYHTNGVGCSVTEWNELR